MLPQLPPELLTPNNLLLTSFVGIGLAIGAAVVYVKKNLLMPSQAKPTDLIVAGGSFFDNAKLDELKADIKRIAVAREDMGRRCREIAKEEAMEERMASMLKNLLDQATKKPG